MRLSRRDFLKKSVAGAIGVAAAGVVGIPAMAEEEKEALYIPGTYSATAKGYESDVKVTMTFTESKITEVVVDASGETAGIGSKAAEEMPQLILDAQSVDVVTSATASYTKDAIQKAAQDCVNQALIIKPEAAQTGLQFETNEFGNPLWLTKDLGMFKWREKPAEPTEFVAT